MLAAELNSPGPPETAVLHRCQNEASSAPLADDDVGGLGFIFEVGLGLSWCNAFGVQGVRALGFRVRV